MGQNTRPRLEDLNCSSGFGQRRELDLVARNQRELALLPVRLRALDALLGAADEVPVDVPIAIELRATEQHDACSLRSFECDGRTRTQHEQAALRIHDTFAAQLTARDVT